MVKYKRTKKANKSVKLTPKNGATYTRRYTLMKNIITFIFLIFSTVVFATDSDTLEFKNEFIRDFSVIEKGHKYFLKETFGERSNKEIIPGLEVRGKSDKHINSNYKIIAIDSKGGYLKIEYQKTIDLRSFGDKLKNKTGIFYVAYK